MRIKITDFTTKSALKNKDIKEKSITADDISPDEKISSITIYPF